MAETDFEADIRSDRTSKSATKVSSPQNNYKYSLTGRTNIYIGDKDVMTKKKKLREKRPDWQNELLCQRQMCLARNDKIQNEWKKIFVLSENMANSK